MFLAFALILIATAGGAVLTYLYDEDAPLAARLCMGCCTGLAALGLVGFVIASFLGLTPVALLLSAVVIATPLALFIKPSFRSSVQADVHGAVRGVRRAVLHPNLLASSYFIFYALVAVMLYFFFDRAMVETADGIYTGATSNLGDLPFHFASITSFVYGQNFPPEDPSYAGTSFAYPFIADFVAAMLMRAGASLRDALLLHNMALALSFVGVLHRWTLKLTRNQLAGFLAPALTLFSGGLGWIMLWREWRASGQSIFSMLMKLPHDYTILSGNAWRWGNALTSLLITQRSILFGLPLAVTVFTLLWSALNEEKKAEEVKRKKVKGKREETKPSSSSTVSSSTASSSGSSSSLFPFTFFLLPSSRRMIAAGVITGLLLLIHAHTFLTVMGVAACLAILRDDWRAWSVLFGLGAVVAFIAYRWERFRALVGYYPNAGWLPRVLLFGAGAALAAGACLTLLGFLRDALRKKEWPWREWAVFFAAALLLAVPQMLWVMSGSSVEAKSFIGLHFGWDKDEEASIFIFWLKNTGLFIPLLIAALLWSGKEQTVERRRLFFYLPFTLCFIGPNLVKLAPWPWDNIKVLFYWYVASVPLVALVLARLWQSKWPLKILMAVMLLSLTLSGALDVWRISSKQINQREYERDGVLLAEKIVQLTPPRALILHAPTYNPVVFLTGRRSLLGYAGQVWSRGLEYGPRQTDIKNIYAGAYNAENLLAKHKVDYVVVTPVEREKLPVDDAFFARYPLIAEVGAYRLYQIKRP